MGFGLIPRKSRSMFLTGQIQTSFAEGHTDDGDFFRITMNYWWEGTIPFTHEKVKDKENTICNYRKHLRTEDLWLSYGSQGLQSRDDGAVWLAEIVNKSDAATKFRLPCSGVEAPELMSLGWCPYAEVVVLRHRLPH
jgi:hypothetical protein